MSSQVIDATCELCRVEAATFYCHSDAAYLCSACDRHVHSANFLSARHIRHPISDSGGSCRGILVSWGRKLGLGEWTSSVVGRACWVMRLMIGMNSNHPRFRVCLAASFWFGMRMCGPRLATSRNLKVLEEVSCVPANLIAAVGAKVELALTRRRRRRRRNIGNGRERLDLDLEEGWAESSV